MSYEERAGKGMGKTVSSAGKRHCGRLLACAKCSAKAGIDGGCVGGATSRAAGDMIREAARCETLHLDPSPRPALVDSDLPLPVISGQTIVLSNCPARSRH